MTLEEENAHLRAELARYHGMVPVPVGYVVLHKRLAERYADEIGLPSDMPDKLQALLDAAS